MFPPHCIDIRSMKNRKAHEVPWKDRTPTAFFRGNSTGPGVDAVTNQRIALAALSASWAKNEQYSAGNKVDGVRFLDAGLVGWNLRDRKLQGRPMTYIKPTVLGIQLVDRVPMYAQVRYKYHIYVDGHCAAMRYASMMPLGEWNAAVQLGSPGALLGWLALSHQPHIRPVLLVLFSPLLQER